MRNKATSYKNLKYKKDLIVQKLYQNGTFGPIWG